MQTPGLFKEKATIRRNRGVLAKDVGQCRDVGAVRMASLHRLLKLPWISEKDDAFCGLRYCKDVGERHLCRFIDKQRIEGPRASFRAHSQAVPAAT
jgi:hypothetical protein